MKKLLLSLIILINMPLYPVKQLSFMQVKDKQIGYFRPQFFRYMANLFNATVFIETGTYGGDSTAKARSAFNEIYTIELSEPLFKAAQKRFQGTEVVTIFGESGNELTSLLPQLKEKKLLILLDAHGSGGITVATTPILDELEAIRKSTIKDAVILIDDVRAFYSLTESPFTLVKLKKAVKAINSAYEFIVYGDVAIAFLSTENVEVSPLLKAFTVSRLFDDSQDINVLEQAEKTIANVQGNEKAALEALTFPESGYYSLWRGLLKMQEGEQLQAKPLFESAKQYKSPHAQLIDL